MLKNIPSILSPELLKILMEMGHGDEIVLAGANYPATACPQRVVRADGHAVNELLDAVMKFFPLDTYVEKPVALMEVAQNDKDKLPSFWGEYDATISKYEPENCKIELIERFAFYERAKKAYAVVTTGGNAAYASIILKKGVVR